MIDFWGYNRQVKANDQVVSSEFCNLTLGGGRMALLQNLSVQYGREIQSIFQIGDPSIYWLSGNAQGNISADRLVGKDGFLKYFNNLSDTCGVVKPIQISLGGDGKCSVVGKGSINFQDGIVEQVQIGTQAGSLRITEGFNIRIATLDIS